MQIHPAAAQVLERLTQNGFEAYIVGGCVRDHLRGVTPHDWDITTNALPDEIRQALAGWPVILTGLQHGTVTAVVDGIPIEVTTYRVDGDYSDHRHPDKVQFTPSLHEDLARRDFTVNAMAYHPAIGLVDPFGGQNDLAAGILRCVGDPDRRFDEDALRIMRALRFAATLSFSLEPATADALRRRAPLLKEVAVERVYHELTRLLIGDGMKEVLLAYPDVLAVVIPEITAMVGCAQHHPCHIADVYTHTVNSIAAAPADALLRLTMLFHDAGKPICRTTDETGCDHFYGHAKHSAVLAEQRLAALKAERHTIDTVVRLVELHDCRFPATRPVVRRWLNRLGEADFRRLLAVKRADAAGQSPALLADRTAEYDALEAVLEEVLRDTACFSREQLAVNGRDLMALGIPAGKGLGQWLDRLLEEVMEERLPNNKEDMLTWVEHQRNEG